MEGHDKRECAESWIFSIAAALISIPVGIKRKSFGPLVFFGSTGAMLDIILSVSNCEREFQQKQQALLEQQQLGNDPFENDGVSSPDTLK